MITEIGALVGIIKGLADIAKDGGDWLRKPKKENVEAVERLQERVAGIAAQLYQTVALLKTIPAWLRQCDDLLFQPEALPAEEIQRQHTLLHRLISESRYDYCSDAFYRTKYDALPGLTKPMEQFRELLERLEVDHGKIRFDVELQALHKDWFALRTRLRDLKNQAEEIRLRANELHGSLINELESAGAVRAG